MLASLKGATEPGSTADIVLRAPASGDFAALAEIRRDPDMQAMLLAVIDATDDAAVREWIDRRAHDANGVFRILADAKTGEALGYVQITDIHRRNRHGSLGIAIRRHAQGRGIGTAALNLLHALARDACGLEKLLLTVRADNAAARALYRRAGYRMVGTLERHFRDRDGGLHDVMLLERALRGDAT